MTAISSSQPSLVAKQVPISAELSSSAALLIVQHAVREGVGVDELVRLAHADPSFALRVMSLVNSPALRRGAPIRDITQAATLLGVRGLRNVALSLAVSELIPARPDAAILLVQSLRRALAARALAPCFGAADRDACFTTGLLLEVGLMVKARDDLGHALELAKLPAEHRVLHEIANNGQSHPEVGAQIAVHYKLSPDMADAIRHHHAVLPPSEPLCRLVWLAERVAGVFETGAVGPAREALFRTGGELGVEAQLLERLLLELPAQVSAMASAFQRDVGEQPDLNQLRDDANARLVEINQQYLETVATLRRVVAEKEELALRLEQLNQTLATQATTDALTGLLNRRALEDALARDFARAQRSKEPLSLLMLDVDHFKRFNDTHGHLVGDEVLCHLGKLLQGRLRESDLVARYGGEEFCILLPEASAEGALLAARRLRLAVERSKVCTQAGELSVTSSFGVATFEPSQETLSPQQLLRNADRALYMAKEHGRNRVIHFSSASDNRR